jgi:uncharacterized membrane protein
MNPANIILVSGGTLTGLLAGLFYAFNVAFIPALRHLKGTEHIAAMQAVNVKIINPVFFLSFFGPAILLPLGAILYWEKSQFGLLVAASLLHILGGIGVTAMGNIPLNDRLEKVDVSQTSEADADQIRKEFQGSGTPWMFWHNVRTLAEIAATALVVIACLSENASR